MLLRIPWALLLAALYTLLQAEPGSGVSLRSDLERDSECICYSYGTCLCQGWQFVPLLDHSATDMGIAHCRGRFDCLEAPSGP